MMLFSPPGCDFRVPSTTGRHTVSAAFTPPAPSVFAWLVDSLSTSPSASACQSIGAPSSRRNSHPQTSPQSAPLKNNKDRRASLSDEMSFEYDYYQCSPRSPAFEPILGSITEAAEIEDGSDVDIEAKPSRPSLTKIDSASHDMPEAFIPDISIGSPELATATAKGSVIQFARMTTDKVISVRRVLRKVLEADKVRRRKVLKVYLKALTFLHYMLKAHDRYGSAMMTTAATLDRFAAYRDSPSEPAFELHDYPQEESSNPVRASESKRERKRREKLEQLREADEMKFSHSLQFNAVPDWSNHYVAYSNLKKQIYGLETQINQKNNASTDAESSPLLNGAADDPDKAFTNLLDAELEKVTSFYQLKEVEIYGELDALINDEADYEREQDEFDQEQQNAPPGKQTRSTSIFKQIGFNRPRTTSTVSGRSAHDDQDDDDDDEDSDVDANETSRLRQRSPDGQRRRRRTTDENNNSDGLSSKRRTSVAFDDYNDMAFSALYDEGVSLKKRTVSVYVSLCELRSFIQLNKTGFEKVLKKFDKILDRKLKSQYLNKYVYPAYPFQQSTMDKLSQKLDQIERAYSKICTKGDVAEAKRELRLHLREHVVWERNTVWREMIGIERKAQAANIGITQTLLGRDVNAGRVRRQGDENEPEIKEVVTPIGRYRCPQWLISKTFWTLVACIAVFVVLLVVPIMEKPEQQNCLAMVVFVSALWATEAIPLFVTSLLVPFLAVTLDVVRSDVEPHKRLGSKQAASYVFAAMWTPVIMLLLGGFTIAAALSKYNIAKMMATFVLSKAGTKPRTVLLTNMFVAMFASMWISNVAAPVLCFSIIQPILRNLPADSNMTKALLLGIALASNIGGAASPIASPQNLIALQNMNPEPSWGIWFFIALPVCIVSILLIWGLLVLTFQPGKGTTIVPIRPMKDKFTGVQWFISIVTIVTIVLWCVSHQLEDIFGDMGVVAIIPLVLFFGTGILTKEDFNNFLWTIIILAAGGLALGKSVNSSGLLHTIAESITASVEGMSLYGVLVVFCGLILVIATFISHTVAALIVLPLVQQVGQSMPEPHPNLLVMGAVLMASGAMGLPTSGFPNMTAIMMEDQRTGQRYLDVKHFLTRGVPASIVTFFVIITLGYGLMLAAGF